MDLAYFPTSMGSTWKYMEDVRLFLLWMLGQLAWTLVEASMQVDGSTSWASQKTDNQS